ncbi:hypothetical protein [Puniceibacterium sp. IMCC21224]|uniref:hypothetical protein n=1 Tax=Puniceibacterium sp. IMCC21224 TaxID=1618204 RepID=UPI00064D8E8C|nr:hypothetical protein [Puniceibacterium sp. IMCC21224]KMK67688.1 hypothetical protein IMCC21224_112560 [Puniceibacterium sp. IMCC21224]
MQTFAKLTAILALTGLAACEGSDLERGALGGVGGYAIDRATGGDGTVGAAVGVAAGVTCDDLTPGVCN